MLALLRMLDNTLSMLELRLLFLCTSRRFELAVADEDDEADDELEFDSSSFIVFFTFKLLFVPVVVVVVDC